MRRPGIRFLLFCLLALLTAATIARPSSAQTPTTMLTMAATSTAAIQNTPTPISATRTTTAPTPTPASTLVPSGTITPYDEARKSFYGTIGTICAAGALFGALLVLFGIVRLLNLVYERRVSPELTIISASKSSNAIAEDTQLAIRVYNEFREFQEAMQHALKVLGGHIELQASKDSLANMLRPMLSLEAPFINHSMLKRLEGPNPSDIRLNLGPLQVPSSAVNWLRGFRKRNFMLLVEQHYDDGDITTISIVLTQDNHVRLAVTQPDDPTDPRSLRVIIEKVIWAISQISGEEIILNENKPAELLISRGLRYLAEFHRDSNTIEPLRMAIAEFGNAARVSDRWEFQASLLEAFSLQLSQSAPKEALLRVTRLRERFGQQEPLKSLLTYLLGVVSFYTYDPDILSNAIRYFEEIRQPIVRQLARVDFSTKQRYALYLLAQSNIAITKAHQMIYEQSTETKQHLGIEADRIAQRVQNEIARNGKYLGGILPEIEWRALNAHIIVFMNKRDSKSLKIGLQRCEEALDVAPYALDVKANKGTLKLLIALQQSQLLGQDPVTLSEFIEAREIFEELEHVGWDPSFVKYRLGTIRRVQGLFDDAGRLLQEASGVAQDVGPAYIEDQLAKVELGDTNLTESDIP